MRRYLLANSADIDLAMLSACAVNKDDIIVSKDNSQVIIEYAMESTAVAYEDGGVGVAKTQAEAIALVNSAAFSDPAPEEAADVVQTDEQKRDADFQALLDVLQP